MMNEVVQECLGNDYIMITSVSLQATHLVIFINKRLSPLVSNVETDFIATGFKNMMGNKGAVKIQFDLVDTKIVVMNSHLHSGMEGVSKRNNDVTQLLNKFIYGTTGNSKQ